MFKISREQLYRTKRKEAHVRTRKIEESELAEMEEKLQQTGMGMLYNKDTLKTMSSLDEKVRYDDDGDCGEDDDDDDDDERRRRR